MAKYTSRKRSAYGLSDPLPDLSPVVIKAQRSPSAANNGSEIGTMWVNVNPSDANFNNVWMLTSVSAGSANWEPIGMDTDGAAPISKYIVDADGTGDFTTVQAALDAANTAAVDATVYVRPGVYVENLVLYDEIDIVGTINTGTTITGVHIPPAIGRVAFQNLTLGSATDIFNSAIAGLAEITLDNCIVNIANGYTFNLVNWTGTFNMLNLYDISIANGVAINTGGATVWAFNSGLGAGAGNTMVVSGNVEIESCDVFCPFNPQTGSVLDIDTSTFSNTVTLSNNTTGAFTASRFSTGATASVVQSSSAAITLSQCTVDTSNNPAIDGAGAGTLVISGVEFLDNAELAATLTLGSASQTKTASILSGDIAVASCNPTNTNIASCDVDPILQSNLNTGVAPTGATGDTNIMYLQDRTTMKQFILGAGQTILAPRLENDGLLISLDLTNSEGAEYYFGHTTRSRHIFVVGTSPAFFVESTFKVADCGTSDPLLVGFRNLAAPNANYTTYFNTFAAGLLNGLAADVLVTGAQLNGGVYLTQNSGDAWLDGETHTVRINVSAAGVCTVLYDGNPPTIPLSYTFPNATNVIPYIHHLFSAAGVPAAIHLQSFRCGYQSWNQ